MVGRIVELGNKASRVLLTTDINSQIPIYFERSKYRAILIGKKAFIAEKSYKTIDQAVTIIENYLQELSHRENH